MPTTSGGASLPASGNLAAHFAADAITPQSDNTALSSWTDSISGLSATQPVGANQPVYRTNRMGGKPSVQATGTKWLYGAFPALKAVIDSQLYTVMIVVSNVVSFANGMVFGNSANSGANTFGFQATGSSVGRYANSNTLMCVPWSSAGFMTFGESSSPTALWTPQAGTANEVLYARGMAIGRLNNTAGPATSSASGNFAIFARDDTGALAGKADLYEIIVWNRVLTEVEWAQAEAWACNKYSQPLPWASLTSLDVHFGDSLSIGVNASDVSKSPPYVCEAARGRTFGQWAMYASGGTTWGGMQGHINDAVSLAAYLNLPLNVVAWEWYNEKNTGKTPAQAWADAQAFVTAFRAAAPASAKLGMLSSTGYLNDGTDPYASVRGAYNALLDSGAAGIVDVYSPIHSDATAGPLIGNSTAYANNSATYWSGDGIHLNAAGYNVLSGVHKACLDAMRP